MGGSHGTVSEGYWAGPGTYKQTAKNYFKELYVHIFQFAEERGGCISIYSFFDFWVWSISKNVWCNSRELATRWRAMQRARVGCSCRKARLEKMIWLGFFYENGWGFFIFILSLHKLDMGVKFLLFFYVFFCLEVRITYEASFHGVITCIFSQMFVLTVT